MNAETIYKQTLEIEKIFEKFEKYLSISWLDIALFFIIIVFAFILIALINKIFLKIKKKNPRFKTILGFINFFIALFSFILGLNFVITNLVLQQVIIILFISIIIYSFVPIFRNIIGGFYLYQKRPFNIGDYIQIQNYYGEVIEISWRHTSLLNAEGGILNIPNYLFLTNVFENVNVGQKEQLITLKFEFNFDIPIEKIQTALYEAAISCPYAYSSKKPIVILEETDYVKEINKFKLSLYLFDAKYENMLIDYINESVFVYLKSKTQKN